MRTRLTSALLQPEANLAPTRVGSYETADEPVMGPAAEIKVLREILATLKSIDAKTPEPKVETRGRTKTTADSNQGS